MSEFCLQVAAMLIGVGCENNKVVEPERITKTYTPERPELVQTVKESPAWLPRPPTVETKRVTFVVGDSFRASALGALTSPQLDELDRVFLGRFDVHALVPSGAAVHAWLAGDHLVAAEVGLADGRRVRAAFFVGSVSTQAGWYDEDGLSLASEILGRPVSLSRITSRFGERLHPLKGIRTQHRGVDYGAIEGTPVFAVGDGVVLVQGTDGSAGNHIKIRHRNGYESWYLHLCRFDEKYIIGFVVKQGATIGYVGMTGMATGPHLHYELHREGLALDPLRKLSLPQTALGPLAQPSHRKFLEALP